MVQCTFCDHDNPHGAKQCASCGAELPADGERNERLPGTGNVVDIEFGDVLALLRSGRKIDAIKAYREHTGVGLAEAKQAVEAIAYRHGIASKSGCAGMVLALVACACVVGLGMIVVRAVP